MKTIEAFLSDLRRNDVHLWAEGEGLRYKAPPQTLTPTLRQELKERKAEILTFLHNANTATRSNLPLILPASREQDLPLSFAQQRLWFLDQLDPGCSAYNIPTAYRLIGQLNITALEQSLNEILQRHEVLRTTFPSQDGQPKPVLTPQTNLTLPVVDLEEFPETERKVIVQQLAKEEAQQPFDLATGPLFRFKLLRLAAVEHVLLLTIHHIVFDGWSYDILFQELAALYEAWSTDKPSLLPSPSIQYADFANWQRQWLQGEVLESQLSYWKQQLSGHLPILQLPTDYPRPTVQTYRGAHQTRSLPPKLSKALKALSLCESATLFMTLLAAFKILLYRYSGQTDIIVGTPIAGRNQKEIEELIGFFVNSLVLRTDLERNPSFRELLGRVREVTLGAYAHQDLPFEKLVEELQPERDPNRTPLFQVWFNMVNLADTQLELPGLLVERLGIKETPSKFDLTLYIQEKNCGIKLELVYNAKLFTPERMVEMLDQFQYLLQQIVESPEEKIAVFSLVTTKAELLLPNPSQTLTSAWEETVHTRFSRQASWVPQHLAVADAQVAWSYAELEQRANQLANYLLGNGIGSQDIVAIYGHRSAALVWAVLGVLKAGAAFVILDPAYPEAHLIDRLCIAKPRGWLQLKTDSSLPVELEEFVKTLSCCSLQLPQRSITQTGNLLTEYSTNDPAVAIAPDDLAYVTFTSGTTGKPKGILGTHRPLSHFLQWHCQTFDLNQSDRFSLLSGLSHDPLLRDIFTPLWLGATLCVPEPKDIETPGRLTQWMRQQKVSITHLTPAMGQILTENTPATSEISSLRYVFFGGDLLTKGDVVKIRKLAPTATCVNFYGATETPQAMGYFPLSNSSDKDGHSSSENLQESIPLGRGIEGVQLLILNTAQQLTGIGEVGEIHIRTPYLAKGYIDDKQLTQERFILNPFTKTRGDLLYKTGDSARYLPDGNIEFLGRIDNQVKLRGFRIELGEIEAALAQYPKIGKTIVIPREDNPGNKRLVAYIVPKQQQASPAEELRRFLKQKLPEYMVPNAFVFLDALPLTPNGKVDLYALPTPDSITRELEETFIAPRDELEAQLTKIWEKVLAMQPIGVSDNFFDLGGYSLLTVKLFAQIEKTFQTHLPLATIFQSPTIEELAKVLRSQGGRLSSDSLENIETRDILKQREYLSPQNSLVMIKSGGLKQPLFLIHDGDGETILYLNLARHLDSDRSVYGLQPYGQESFPILHTRISDMAAYYVEKMRTIQPKGPYLVGGLCAGGVLAFEIACQLQAQGEEIAIVALLDSTDVKAPSKKGRIAHQRLNKFSQALNQSGQLKGREKWLYLLKTVIKKVTNTLTYEFSSKSIRLKNKFQVRLYRHYLDNDLSIPRFLQNICTRTVYLFAAQEYTPEIYQGQVVLFRATETVIMDNPSIDDTPHIEKTSDPLFGWSKRATEGVEVYDVPGGHSSMLQEPYVKVLAEKIEAYIKAALPDESNSTPTNNTN